MGVRSLCCKFEYSSGWDFSVYKGEKITGGELSFNVGESELFGELSYHQEFKDFPAHTGVIFACTSELLADLIDKREELVGASVTLWLDENQKAISHAPGPDPDLFFDIRETRRVAVTKIDIAFAPYTKLKKGNQSSDGFQRV